MAHGLAPGARRRGARAAMAMTAILVSIAPALGPGPARAATVDARAAEGARPVAAIVPPPLLSQTGLYDADGRLAAGNLPYSPQYPLWTDGAAEARWIHLPAGELIDVSDAALAPEAGVPGVHEVAPGRRHSVPGRADCLACHGAAPSPALGFSALQLSDDRDPLAPHAEPLPEGAVTLSSLVERGLLSPPAPSWAATPPRIGAADPVERAALGYLAANCGACHNDTGPLARLGLALHHRVAGDPLAAEPALLTAVDAAGRWQVPGVHPDSSRVVAPAQPSLTRGHLRRRKPPGPLNESRPPARTAPTPRNGPSPTRLRLSALPG